MWLLVLGLAAVLALGACGGDDEGGGGGGTAAEGEMATVKVGTLPISNTAPVYLGIQKGFFREEGLNVQAQLLQAGNELITGAISGDFDFITAGYVPVISARSKNLPIKIVAANDAGADTPEEEWTSVMVKKGSDIRDPEDLAGKTIALNALKGVGEVDVKAALEKEGVDPDSVKLLEVPFPEMPPALEAGRVDAVWAPEPFLTQILGQGGKEVLAPLPVLGPEWPNAGYETTDRVIAEKKDVVDRFVRAINKSVEYAAQNPDEVRKIVPTYTRIPPDVVQKIRLPVFTSTIDQAKLQQVVQQSQKYGVITRAPSMQDLLYQPSGS